MKLFSKSFEEHRIFEKRRHPETFVLFALQDIFKQSRRQREKEAFPGHGHITGVENDPEPPSICPTYPPARIQ
ncbi:hypothetical protein [Novacetimonas cocois]|uniref:hypothetical protein n=1 Tax=Novacetimonas cocois TaxID=1747507 RepID=UPI000DE4A7E7|nr:hypothetical protein [Novacetimonas cocois]